MASKKRKKSHCTVNDDDDDDDNGWTEEMIKKFIDILMDVTLCKDVKELKNHVIFRCMWKEIGKKMNIDQNTLKKLWYYRLHMQLFCPEPIFLLDYKIKVIEYLYGKGVTTSKEINWKHLCLCFDGVTRQFLYKIFYRLFELGKSKTKDTDFTRIVNYLYTDYIPQLINHEEDKILPRLQYNKGQLKWIDIDLLEGMSTKCCDISEK